MHLFYIYIYYITHSEFLVIINFLSLFMSLANNAFLNESPQLLNNDLFIIM